MVSVPFVGEAGPGQKPRVRSTLMRRGLFQVRVLFAVSLAIETGWDQNFLG